MPCVDANRSVVWRHKILGNCRTDLVLLERGLNIARRSSSSYGCGDRERGQQKHTVSFRGMQPPNGATGRTFRNYSKKGTDAAETRKCSN